MTKQRLLLAKHLEFEAAAAQVRDGRRSIVKTPRGVLQHVVETENSVLRWPTTYAGVTTKSSLRSTARFVRYESLVC